MAKTIIPAVRGMHDILPAATGLWQRVERAAHALFYRYGYREIRTPLVERLDLFERQLGESTDVVQKEMYAFTDSLNDEKLALRPEATVSTMRALLADGAHRAGVSRVWYGGAMFRHERPQKGRYRQFHQMGCEAVGSSDPLLETEQIILLARLWEELGIGERLKLTLNNLGDSAARARHRQLLQAYFYDSKKDWDELSRARLDKNPLRLLDDKNPEIQTLAAAAPLLAEQLDDDAKAHVQKVKDALVAHNIAFEEDPRLVRGLDYYNLTVFEWTLASEGSSQNAVCGGGRYDQLAETIGPHALAGCGFALGVERLVSLCMEAAEESKTALPPAPAADCYLAVLDADCYDYAFAVAEECRAAGIGVFYATGAQALGKQIKKCEALNIPLLLVVGSSEKQQNCITIKGLTSERAGTQQTAERAQLASVLQTLMNKS